MNVNLYNKILKSRFELCQDEVTQIDGERYVKTGFLVDKKSGRKVTIRNYIIRFVDEKNYSESFGYQWSTFRNLQHDSKNHKKISEKRVFLNSKWKKKELEGKIVLECGSGNGRFTEIFYSTGATVIAVDMSVAIDVNKENLGLHPNVLYIQDDITKLYYMKNKADYVFCYGVLQHTPHPRKTLHRLHQYAKSGGKLSVDVYEKMRRPSPFYGPKYFWRPITKKMDNDKLLSILKWYIPKYIGFDTRLRQSELGKCILGLIPIPCWNYFGGGLDYTDEQRIQHAIMDTFDALSPAYDYPCSEKEFKRWAIAEMFEEYTVFHGANGLVMNAVK